ncbi:MAG: PorT family protein [Acidobacteria bacterium]|nr:PorT family protein [Acidobacteriota bacterium]
MTRNRHRTLTGLIAILAFAATIFAQDDKENYIGFKGGVSIPQLSSSDDNELSRDYKSRVAPNFGAFFEFGVAKRTSLQFEVNYAGQGGKRNGIQPVTQPIPGLPALPAGNYYYANFNNTAKLTYLEVPVLAKYKFGPKTKPRLFVNGGAYYGLLVKAETVTNGNSTLFLDRDGRVPLLLPPVGTPFPAIPFDATTDIKDELNKHNFGLTGGGGFEIPHKKNYFVFDACVSYGLVSIQKDTVLNGNSKTGNLVISFGYAFGLGK